MDSNVTSVDTLVYQLEDDDASVRWDTLQRLRKRAAVERAQLPVRNPRRFLHCLRRRLADDDPRFAREVLLLLRDVVDVLGDDVDLILSSILPHLITRLPHHHDSDPLESTLDEDAYSLFRKYVNVTNDLAGAANLLMNMGLANAHASVREAALLSLVRLLDERYGGRRMTDASTTSKKGGGLARIDAALFTDLVQAIVPVLEDTDECVVVAAEEAIAKLQLFWGSKGFQDVMAFLSSEDKATLAAHDATIRAFVDAASSANSGRPASVSASQVLALRASLPTGSFAVSSMILKFGFVAIDVVDALVGNRGNSNAEWKKRTVAVEQLYAAAKQVDPLALIHVAGHTQQDSEIGSFMELLEILIRLLQDIDVHLVKRSLQILTLLFYKLEPTSDGQRAIDADLSLYMERVMPALVKTAANHAEDDEIPMHLSMLFQALFSGQIVSVAVVCRSLLSSLQHRRLQVREEALRIWIILLLTAQAQSLSTKDMVCDTTVHALGKALGDGSARVRLMAMELAAVVGRVTHHDVCAIVESTVDEFTLERIDLDALYTRSRDKRLPTLMENGQLRLQEAKLSGEKPAADAGDIKAAHTRSPVRTSTQRTVSEMTTRGFSRTASTELLDGPSELLQLNPRETRGSYATAHSSSTPTQSPPGLHTAEYSSGSGAVRASGRLPHAPTGSRQRDEASDRQWHSDVTSAIPAPVSRDVSSAPGEPIVSDKLQALKRRTEQLKKSVSSKQLAASRPFNPQEGECEFASAGYAAQQQPPSKAPIVKQVRQHYVRDQPKEKEEEEEEEEEATVIVHESRPVRHPSKAKAFATPREEDDRETLRTPQQKKVVESPKTGLPSDDRPIRPMRDVDLDEYPSPDNSSCVGRNSTATTKRQAEPITFATKKRLEAKQLEAHYTNEVDEEPSDPPSPEVPQPATRAAVSLATRKRQEQLRHKAEAEANMTTDTTDKPFKKSVLAGGVPPATGKQEPRYLEPHELQPLKEPKHDASKLTAHISSNDWETVFEALTIVRRLAMHHPKLVEDKLHAIITEILKQVPNLRSSVAKNALLALDSLCMALGRQLDSEVESIMPVLLKRSTDSNTFVCDSTSQSIHRVIVHCSISRVVPAIAVHLTSRAIAIRREVARSMHVVMVSLGDHVLGCKELPSMLQTVGKCLEDSNNEVRDAAKQSVLYLYNEVGMDGDKIKKLLPTSVHAKVTPLLTRRIPTTTTTTNTNANVNANTKLGREPPVKQTGSTSTPTAPPPVVKATATVPVARRGSTSTSTSTAVVDTEALATLSQQLDSSNWKDRLDALSTTAAFVAAHGTSLCESGKLLQLFDSVLKRMDDGNAKVATLAFELLPALIASLGNGMELVLQNFVPVLAKGLAASQPKQAGLALAAVHALCANIDARLLCPHIVAVARNANSRIKPTLLDVLNELAAKQDEKNQFALTRYVLPLALELLKEGKSDVKDGTARLLRTLYESLPSSVTQAASKLSSAQQDKLTAILGRRD